MSTQPDAVNGIAWVLKIERNSDALDPVEFSELFPSELN